ncbi:MAG: crossover junction endodeoxyribonuclease RuvC [Phycisphaerales bacterium]
MRVLGIDPGSRITGYGCVESPASGGDPKLVEAGVIRLNGRDSFHARLAELYEDLGAILDHLTPDRVVVEKLYSHYAHPTTAIRMGHARGVILLAAQVRSVGLAELGATEIKKSITGNGHASKRQMQESVRAQLGLDETPKPADVADAIAIALCASRRLGLEQCDLARR